MSDKHIALTAERQSVLTRSSNFHGNCPSSPGFTKGKHKQIHHILPCTVMKTRGTSFDSKKEDYIEDCLWVTPWDINDGENLIGLPLKNQYRYAGGKTPQNLPCHNCDHPKYSDEVRDWLKNNLWNTLTAKQKVHRVDAESILSQLSSGISTHKAFLQARGLRNQGTQHSWQKRFEETDSWFEPFSMSEDPTPRKPPGVKGDRPVF